MLMSISKMKFPFFTLSILVSLIEANNGQKMTNIKTNNQPANSHSGVQTRAMVSTCQPDGDRLCYLAEAVELILFGEKRNRTDIDTLLDIIPDNETLDWMLTLGLQQLALFGLENPVLVPGEYEKQR